MIIENHCSEADLVELFSACHSHFCLILYLNAMHLSSKNLNMAVVEKLDGFIELFELICHVMSLRTRTEKC